MNGRMNGKKSQVKPEELIVNELMKRLNQVIQNYGVKNGLLKADLETY